MREVGGPSTGGESSIELCRKVPEMRGHRRAAPQPAAAGGYRKYAQLRPLSAAGGRVLLWLLSILTPRSPLPQVTP